MVDQHDEKRRQQDIQDELCFVPKLYFEDTYDNRDNEGHNILRSVIREYPDMLRRTFTNTISRHFLRRRNRGVGGHSCH